MFLLNLPANLKLHRAGCKNKQSIEIQWCPMWSSQGDSISFLQPQSKNPDWLGLKIRYQTWLSANICIFLCMWFSYIGFYELLNLLEITNITLTFPGNNLVNKKHSCFYLLYLTYFNPTQNTTFQNIFDVWNFPNPLSFLHSL